MNTLTPEVEAYSVRVIDSPSWDPTRPWLGAPTVPVLCDGDGAPRRYLGYGTPLAEAVAKAEEVMAGWAVPRRVVSRVDMGDMVALAVVVGEVVG